MDNIDSIHSVEKVQEKRSERKHKAKEKLKWKNIFHQFDQRAYYSILWHDSNDMLCRGGRRSSSYIQASKKLCWKIFAKESSRCTVHNHMAVDEVFEKRLSVVQRESDRFG